MSLINQNHNSQTPHLHSKSSFMLVYYHPQSTSPLPFQGRTPAHCKIPAVPKSLKCFLNICLQRLRLVLYLLDAEKINVSEETFFKRIVIVLRNEHYRKIYPPHLDFFWRVILNLIDKFCCQNLEENVLTVFVFQTQYTDVSIFSLWHVYNLNYDLLIQFLSSYLYLFIIFQGTITQSISLLKHFLFQLRDGL